MSFRNISLLVFLVAFVGVSPGASAQTTPHIEIEGGLQLPGGIVPVVGPSNYPRQAPDVIPRDVAPFEVAVGGRVFVMKRFSVRTTYSWSRTTTMHFAYERPPQSPVFSGYTSELTMREHHRGLSIVPSFDLADAGRIRPWLGAGVAWRLSNDDKTYTNIEFQSGAISTSQAATADGERMLVASGGLRIIPTRRIVAGTAVRWNFLRTTPETFPELLPRSPRLMVDFSIGVAF